MTQILTASGRTRWESALRGLNPHIVDLGAYSPKTELRYHYYNAVHGRGSAGRVYHSLDTITQAEKDAVSETGGPGSWNNIYGVFDGAYSAVAWYNNLTGYPYVDFDFGQKRAWHALYWGSGHTTDWPTSVWLYGSNNPSSREDNLVYSTSGVGGGAYYREISPANFGNYRYWRFKGWKSAANYWWLYEVYFYHLPQFVFVNVPSQHIIEVYNDTTLKETNAMSVYSHHTMEFREDLDAVNRLVVKEGDGSIYFDMPFSPEFMHKYTVWPMGLT